MSVCGDIKEYKKSLPKRYRRRKSAYHKNFDTLGLYVCKNCKRVFSLRGYSPYCSVACKNAYRKELGKSAGLKNVRLDYNRGARMRSVLLYYFNFGDVGLPGLMLRVIVSKTGNVYVPVVGKLPYVFGRRCKVLLK